MKKCLVKVYFQRSQSNILSGYLLTFLPDFEVYREWRETVSLPQDISISALTKLLKDLQSHHFTAYPSALDIRQQSARGTAPAVLLE